MANVDNWAMGGSSVIDRIMRKQAQDKLNELKATEPQHIAHRVDKNTFILLPETMSPAKVKKRIEEYKRIIENR